MLHSFWAVKEAGTLGNPLSLEPKVRACVRVCARVCVRMLMLDDSPQAVENPFLLIFPRGRGCPVLLLLFRLFI